MIVGNLKSYISYDSESGGVEYSEFITDNKVNPFYVFWETNSLVMPWDFTEITDNILDFYPNNILGISVDGDVDNNVKIQYEGDYIKIYDPVYPSNYDDMPPILNM